MFVLVWTTLLLFVRDVTADTGASMRETTRCFSGFCITLSEGEITAEAGLCVVIPCSFTTSYRFTIQHLVWYKCEPSKPRCDDSDMIFHTNKNNRKVQSGFKGRVSLLEPDVSLRTCSIIINDLIESDSGSYQLRVNGFTSPTNDDGFTFSLRANVSVKDLTQKPTVMVRPLTEGQQTTLTCTAPGLCSGSAPKITWTWRGAGEEDSHITGNITAFKTENVTAVTQRHSSTLMFNASAEHHGTKVTCKVSFTNNITTEETETLNVTSAPSHSNTSATVSAQDRNSTAVECVSCNNTGEAKEDLATVITDVLRNFLMNFKHPQVIIAFLIGMLLSATICCVARRCCRKQKSSGNVAETLEMMNTQAAPMIDAGQAVENDGTHDQEAAAGGAKAAGQSAPGPQGVEYADINFSLLKRGLESTRETPETEYAEIKNKETEERRDNGGEDSEMMEGKEEEEVMTGEDKEEKQCMSAEEEEEGGEDVAVYSNVNEIMGEI